MVRPLKPPLPIARVPKLGSRAAYLRQAVRDRLIEHRAYVRVHGDDVPEIRDWQWSKRGAAGAARSRDTGADNA